MTRKSFRFGSFTLDLERLALLGPSGQLDLRPKSFEVLRYLVAHAGRVVSKDEVIKSVWPNVTVTDESLTRCISEVRRAIGDEDQCFVKTVPRRGYLFDVPVSACDTGANHGVPTAKPCPSCGSANASGARFCGACGTNLVDPTPIASDSQAFVPESAERRHATVLIASTGLATQLDPEQLRELMGIYRAGAAEIIGDAEGYLAQFLGDGIIAYFGYPKAHEDDAERAVRAGLALAAFVPAHEFGAMARSTSRIGIASGPMVVGDQPTTSGAPGNVAVGEAPNHAAILQLLARPGDVVISASTHRLVGRLFGCEMLDHVVAPGFDDANQPWRVLGENKGLARFDALHGAKLTPFIGREEELGLLVRRWGQARVGDGRVVLLSGEPGIGKSRLIGTLCQRLATQQHTYVCYSCSPHRTQSALYPFTSKLERTAQFDPGDDDAVKVAKLRTLLGRNSDDVDRDAALIGELLSLPAGTCTAVTEMSPQEKRELTLQALLVEMENASTQNPLLMVIEDAHWIDPTSLDLLDRAIGRAPDLPVLIIVTFRPQFTPVWIGQAHVTLHALSRLDRREGAELLSAVTGGKALPDALANQILERTDGVPLFIEELTSAMLESGLVHEKEGQYVRDGTLLPFLVPLTLQASLVARLDRLASARGVAQVGATIGREFSHHLISAVAGMEEKTLDAALDELVASGLLQRRGMAPETAYTFKHALVQDAAYGTLLRSRQRQLHGRIAAALIDKFPGRAQAEPEIVAYHSTEAGDVEQAIGYWLKAGEIASKRSANSEAVSHLKRGLELLRERPASEPRDALELEFQCTIGPNLIATRGYASPETIAAYERARQLMSGRVDLSRLTTVLTGLFVSYYNLGKYDQGFDVARELLDAAQAQQDATGLCIANRMMAVTHNMWGEFDRARVQAEAAWSYYDAGRHGSQVWRYVHDIGVASKCHMGLALWHLGFPDRARACGEEALAIAEQLKHQNTIGYALAYGGMIPAIIGRDFERLEKHAVRAQQVGRNNKMPQWIAWGACLEAPALAARGRRREALERLGQGLELRRQLNNQCLDALFQLGAALVEILADERENAMLIIDGTLKKSEATGERWLDCELWRLKGDLLLEPSSRDCGADAERCYRRAIDIAQQQGSRMYELRATTSLAGLMSQRGQKVEARSHLAPLLDQFTEGFASSDFQSARSILGSLEQ